MSGKAGREREGRRLYANAIPAGECDSFPLALSLSKGEPGDNTAQPLQA